MSLVIDSQESAAVAHHSNTSPGSSTFNNVGGSVMTVLAAITGNGGSTQSSISGVTWNGVAMVQVAGSPFNSSLDNSVSFWRLEGAATGSHTIQVTATLGTGVTSVDILWAGISFTGEDAGSPLGTMVGATGGPSATSSITLNSTTAGNIVLSGGTTGSGWTNGTAPTTKSALLNVSGTTAGDNVILAQQAAGGNITANFSETSDFWTLVAVEVKAAVAYVAPRRRTVIQSRRVLKKAA